MDLNLSQLEAVIRQYLKELDEYSTGLFYYAGHGMQIDGKNYIVPIDCEIKDKTHTILSSYDICKYLDGLLLFKGKTNICILDACRDNPFATSLRDVASGFTQFNTQPKGTIIAYSTSPDKGASDGEGCNGLYTHVLKETMTIPNLKIEDMFKSVRIRVMELSGETQISWEHSSLIGDFYFSVMEQSVEKNISDETIFEYINERFRYNESITDDIMLVKESTLKKFYNKINDCEDLSEAQIIEMIIEAFNKGVIELQVETKKEYFIGIK